MSESKKKFNPWIATVIMAIGGISSERSGVTNLALEGFQGFGVVTLGGRRPGMGESHGSPVGARSGKPAKAGAGASPLSPSKTS